MAEERINAAQLAAAWSSIREKYFSDWDWANAWRCELRFQQEGHPCVCWLDQKQVHILESLDPNDLDLAIVHALCHARTKCPDHSFSWRRRMERIAELAELEEPALAKKILDVIPQAESTRDEREGLPFV
jgi:hypothetical protein